MNTIKPMIVKMNKLIKKNQPRNKQPKGNKFQHETVRRYDTNNHFRKMTVHDNFDQEETERKRKLHGRQQRFLKPWAHKHWYQNSRRWGWDNRNGQHKNRDRNDLLVKDRQTKQKMY